MAKVTLTSKTSAMKSKSTFPIVSLAILFASCTTAYKSGQTPDDVYYSPARPQAEYVYQEKKDDRMYSYNQEAYRDDRYLRMKILDRRYSGLYDNYYSYNPYYYHYYNSNLIYNTPWSSYNYWNYYYNPYYNSYYSPYYYSPVITVATRTPVYNKPRAFDLSVYNPQPTNNPKGNARSSYSNQNSRNTNNYRNSGTNAGNYLRNAFSGSNNNYNSNRSYSSGSTNNSSSRSSSSGSSSNSSSRGNARRG